MPKRENIPKLNRKQSEWLFYGSLLLLALFVFLFVGSREPVLFDDSGSYMRMERIEGVMPLYPIFLLINQYIFGLEHYLDIVIIEQAVLAAICITLFVKEIKNSFTLQYWEGYVVFFLSTLSFTTEMPQAMMTQTILTEGLSYALFYLLVIFWLRTVLRKSYRFLIKSFVIVFFLAMLRSQLQILFGVCGILFLYLICTKAIDRMKKIVAFLIGSMGCILIGIIGIWVTAGTVDGYIYLIRDNIKVNSFIMRIQDPDYYIEFCTGEDGRARNQEETETAIKNEQMAEAAARRVINTSQYTSLIFSRGMYEADIEDIELFDDEIVRGLYRVLYNAVEQEKQRYAYEQRSLWMWKDIVGGIGQVGKTCLPVGNQYYQENYPQIYQSDSFNMIWNRNLQIIGIELLKEHFGRFIYHSVMLLPQAFICTIFFQIKSIYLICHLVTFFLYLSALALMIWGYVDKKVSNKYAEFMALVIGSNIMMVLIISMVFFGQQRYLVYNFGIFYIAYYLLLREFWNIYIRNRLEKRICVRKND